MAAELSDEELAAIEAQANADAMCADMAEEAAPLERAQNTLRLVAALRAARTALTTAHAAGVREGEQREREACAALLIERAGDQRCNAEDMYADGDDDGGRAFEDMAQALDDAAEDIRARSSTTPDAGQGAGRGEGGR